MREEVRLNSSSEGRRRRRYLVWEYLIRHVTTTKRRLIDWWYLVRRYHISTCASNIVGGTAVVRSLLSVGYLQQVLATNIVNCREIL